MSTSRARFVRTKHTNGGLVPATPLYRRIADQIRDAISNGRLGPGSRLKTEAELMSDHGVSRDTIRKAIRELIEQGLVETRGRQGTFVRERQMLSTVPRLPSRLTVRWPARPATPSSTRSSRRDEPPARTSA